MSGFVFGEPNGQFFNFTSYRNSFHPRHPSAEVQAIPGQESSPSSKCQFYYSKSSLNQIRLDDDAFSTKN